MAWEGYWEYAGQELVNTKRTQSYAKVAGLSWFKPVYDDAEFVNFMSVTYTSPAIDEAPWYDPAISASNDFFGFYPLDITGVEDSTITASIYESTSNGGVVGRTRQQTRTMVFSGLLIARSQCGAEYGQRWLRNLLNEQACASGNCGGEALCFLSCSPNYRPLCGPAITAGATDIDNYSRTINHVTVIRGPLVLNKSQMQDKGEAWAVDFTAVAGDPTQYGDIEPILTNFMNPGVANPWVAGSPPPGFFADPTGFGYADGICPTPTYTPIFDPLCPAVIAPPLPPTLWLGCGGVPNTWQRRLITIPATEFPIWSDRSLVFEFNAQSATVRAMRIRMYVDTGSGITDQCNPCGEMYVSYIPVGTSMTVDTATRQVYVTSPGGVQRRADSLVFSYDGTPLEWPEITCGAGLIIALDMPTTQTPPWTELGLMSRY